MADGKLDLTDTIKDGARVVATDATLRQQLLMAFTEDSRLHVREVCVLASSFWTRTAQREDQMAMDLPESALFLFHITSINCRNLNFLQLVLIVMGQGQVKSCPDIHDSIFRMKATCLFSNMV